MHHPLIPGIGRKEQVGFDLQTEKLTLVNLKFLKFRSAGPNVLWEFSPSNLRQCPQGSIVHSCLQAPSQLAWVSSASILQRRNSALKATGRKSQFRLTVPVPNACYLGCFLLTQLRAEVTCWRLSSWFLPDFLPQPSKKGTCMKKAACFVHKQKDWKTVSSC